MKKYHKLVRDRIPEIIQGTGKIAIFEKITDKGEYLDRLLTKLSEEMEEFRISHEPEELADLLEVIHSLAALVDCSPEQLEELRRQKQKERGGFQERILLVQVDDPRQ